MQQQRTAGWSLEEEYMMLPNLLMSTRKQLLF